MTDTGGTPLYLRIADALRQRIEGGELRAGDKLPSLTELQQQWSCSTGVGQKAYGLLADEGLVLRRHGAGYYVRSQEPAPVLVRRPRGRAGDGSPVQAAFAEQGVDGSWRHESSTATADARVADRLRIDVGAPVMHTSYIYLADDVPVQLAESWEPLAVTGDSLIVLPEAGPHRGIGVADRMAVIGIDVGQPVERVSSRTATRAESQRLGVTPGVLVLAIARTYYDQASGRPVETADIVLLGERWVAEYGTAPAA
ncbi:GntR family transcriptional regulator [Streptomyces sp. NPDC005065]|uniref:GntR family transcriptional regulator n=1 Tax=Streptomyces sp. NPDC005065 TaxID=3154461 RepID=UPI0033B05368